MAPDGDEQPEPSFGDFSIEGMQDPLAPRARMEYVEEVDPDPAPFVDLLEHDSDRLPWFGASPWSGPSDLIPGPRRVSRAVVTVAATSVVLGAAALIVWRLVG
ncbi:MAG TPA: hypothetical protein VFZ17_04035 [Acidimicrobiia bacterium]|nr:hypothetical protein [Acidimicrobiia bacterium]